MKNVELYNKTVGILEQAYLNDTLKHSNCFACAVGNLIKASGGYICPSAWTNVFGTAADGEQRMRIHMYTGIAKLQIDSTGYTVTELAAIEYAFETAPKGNGGDEWMFNGLAGVMDCLDKIHENTDKVLTIQSKERFTNTTTCKY